jgi:hypothetical protein
MITAKAGWAKFYIPTLRDETAKDGAPGGNGEKQILRFAKDDNL